MRTGVGPVPAQVMIVGEAFGAEEERTGQPFMGQSGQELNRMLHESGLLRSNMFVTNLVNERPPHNDIGAWIAMKKKDISSGHVPLRDKMVRPIVKEGWQNLMREIKEVKPNLIIAAGNAALWALTGNWGILRWRGSVLQMRQPDDLFEQFDSEMLPKVIPVIHPAAILRQWELRAITMTDFKRVKKEMMARKIVYPKWNFIIRPSYAKVIETIEWLEEQVAKGPFDLTLDLETRAGHISCCGLAWTNLDAISIPLMLRGDTEGYWHAEEEAEIIWRLYKLLTNKNCRVIGQNLLYDCQYTYRHWHFVPNVVFDTMIAHHTAFSGLPKALDYQASMYCDFYQQWKPEKTAWKAGG